MKLLAYIKLTIKQTIRDAGTLFVVFSLFPLLLGGMVSYFQTDVFVPVTEIQRIEISIKDEDNTPLSKRLNEFLDSDLLKDVVEVKNDGSKVKYEVNITKGYEAALVNQTEAEVTVKSLVKEKTTNAPSSFLSSLIDRYNQEVSQSLLIDKKARELYPSAEEANNAAAAIRADLYSAYRTNAFRSRIIPVERNLSSYEFYSVSTVGFMLIMLIMSLAAGVFIERENGLFNRVLSTRISRIEYFNYNLASCSLFALLLNLVLVFSYRLMGLSFKGNLWLLLLIVLAQSILATSVIAVLLAFFNKKSSMVFMNIVLIAHVIMGGMFLPFEKISNNPILKNMNNYAPDILSSRMYKSYILYNDFSRISADLAAMLGVALVFYAISVVKVKIRWGE